MLIINNKKFARMITSYYSNLYLLFQVNQTVRSTLPKRFCISKNNNSTKQKMKNKKKRNYRTCSRLVILSFMSRSYFHVIPATVTLPYNSVIIIRKSLHRLLRTYTSFSLQFICFYGCSDPLTYFILCFISAWVVLIIHTLNNLRNSWM